MAYTPPAGNNANFNFTETGYSPGPPHNFNFEAGAGTSDLLASIVATAASGQSNLPGYIKSVIQATKNLGASIAGYPPVDLSASIGAHPPKDLLAAITAILFKGQKDLGVDISITPPVDLNAYIGMHAPVDLGASVASAALLGELPASINVIDFTNLPAVLKSFTQTYKDLGAAINPGEKLDLGGILHGWAISDLAATLVGGYGPYDIQASLNPIPGQDLSAIIRGWKGFQIPIDLPASVSSWATMDLNAVISLIEATDLGASITAIGKLANLGAIIIPKTILMKRALQISLLEHKDMKAVINFQCFGSAYRNLGASMYTIYKSELKAYITGWYGGGTADTIRDLGAYINAEDYYVEDKFTVTFVPAVRKYTQLNINFSVNDVYKTFDTLPIIYGSFYGANLSATINGILNSYDLGATVTPVLQTNYTELPENVSPKTHEIVIDFNNRWRENWRRFVEIMFKRDGAEPFHYFYVKGSNTIYRVNRERHWTIWADSYLNTEDDMVERRDIRQKYIFNMSNYSTVDEAVRDLIDRVSSYRRASLGASIVGEWGPMADLSAYIDPKVKYSWVKHLGASITGL